MGKVFTLLTCKAEGNRHFYCGAWDPPARNANISRNFAAFPSGLPIAYLLYIKYISHELAYVLPDVCLKTLSKFYSLRIYP